MSLSWSRLFKVKTSKLSFASIFVAEDFNKRIMTPELNEDEMRLLHKEAVELYDLYFKPDAKHKVDVGDHIAKEIFASKANKISLLERVTL